MIVSNDCVSNPSNQWPQAGVVARAANLRARSPTSALNRLRHQRSQFRHTSSMWVPDVAAAGLRNEVREEWEIGTR